MADKMEKIFSRRATDRNQNGDLKIEVSLDISPWEAGGKKGYTSQLHLLKPSSEYDGRKKDEVNMKGNFNPVSDEIYKLFEDFIMKVREIRKSLKLPVVTPKVT